MLTILFGGGGGAVQKLLSFLAYGSYSFISVFAACALVLYHPPPSKKRKIIAKPKVFFSCVVL